MHTCLVCDKELIKKPHESRARYAKKKFCSQICSRKYLKEHKMGWWSSKGRPMNTEKNEIYNT